MDPVDQALPPALMVPSRGMEDRRQKVGAGDTAGVP
jgi:hypothetical protein